MRAYATVLFTAVMITSVCYGGVPVQLYLGLRGGGSAMLTREQLYNVGTTEGIRTVFYSDRGWSAHAKAEALLGLGRIRFGYRFLYNFSSPIGVTTYDVNVGNSRYTTYFNSGATHFFAHYFVLEAAIVNTRHFALVPGIALGSYTGFNIDNTTGERVQIADVTNRRFTFGGELNGEIKIHRVSIVFGPNYYLFSLRDRANSSWKQYQHFIGGDIGLRVNLLKPRL